MRISLSGRCYLPCLAALLGVLPLDAQDYGVHGSLYPVKEKDLRAVIQERLGERLEAEAMDGMYSLRTKAQHYLQEPPPVRGLQRSRKPHTRLFNPSFTASRDLFDLEGNLIVAKGTKVNPLSRVRLSEPLLFFDGTDDEQVAWAREREGKWILTRGKPIDLEKAHAASVYFDQAGKLTQRLQIRSLPCEVIQEGVSLVITEGLE